MRDSDLKCASGTILEDPAAIRIGPFVFRETAYGVVKRLRFVVERLEELRDRLGIGVGEMRVLDLGCGTGTYVTIPLAQIGYRITGLDIDLPSIARARQNATTAGIPDTVFVCGTLENLESAPFHAVICSEVLEHIPDPIGFLRVLHPFLDGRGLLILTVPNGYGYFELESALMRLLPQVPNYADRLERVLVRTLGSAELKKRHYVEYGGIDSRRDRQRNEIEQSSLAVDQTHYQKFTPKKIRAVISAAGFEITGIRNNTLIAGNALNALVRSCDRFLRLNAAAADVVPHALATDWLIAARKRR